MKRLNADTKVHLGYVQAFFCKFESVAGEKYFYFLPFREKNNNKISTRCLSNFKGPIVSYLSAALSCEQRPLFLVTLLFSETLLSFVIQSGILKTGQRRVSKETNPIAIGEKG